MKYAILGMFILVVLMIGCTQTNPINNDVQDIPVIAEKNTIKIGVITPLSGDFAFVGIGFKNAVILAQENFPETKYNYELIFEDDRLDPKMTVLAAQKLINIDNVDAIISVTSGSGNVVSPMTEENQIVHFGIASDSNIAKGKYNFIHWTTPEAEAKVFVKELQKRNLKRVGIIVMNQQGSIAVSNSVKEEMKNTEIKVVSEEMFNFGEKDFRTRLLKIKDSNPDIIFVYAWSPELELIAKQHEDLEITAKLTAIESFEGTPTPELFEGLWYVSAADANAEFANLYYEQFEQAYVSGGPNGYDAANLLVTAFENAGKYSSGKPSNTDVAKELENIKDFSGALGSLSVDANHIVQSEASVKEIRNGKPVTLE